MAMLAEPRRRQKWSLNPRGTAWANDDSKFGQKLMEKMGWTKGKGLGREEQGMKEHLSVKLKDNTKGLGYQGKDDEWIKHYEGFENVLATLNSEENSAANSKNASMNNSATNSDDEDVQQSQSFKSLEAMSKTSRARVHYHKFTRGKDLSHYSADDLGCILGSKRAKILAEVAAQEEVGLGEEAGEDEKEHVDHLNGVTTIKGGSVQEYFARKLKALKKKSEREPPTEDKANEDESEESSSARPAFGANLSLCDEKDEENLAQWLDQTAYKATKKKKKQSAEENDMENINLEVGESEWSEVHSKKWGSGKSHVEENGFENGIGKKKKKRKYDEIKEDVAGNKDISGFAFREVDVKTKEKKKKGSKYGSDETKVMEQVGHGDDELGKKKKEAVVEEHCNEDVDSSCSSKENKKRKRKELESVLIDDYLGNAGTDTSESNKNDKEKKKKKKKDKHLFIDESHVEVADVSVPSKKHKKKKNSDAAVGDNLGNVDASVHCENGKKKDVVEDYSHTSENNNKQYIDTQTIGVSIKKIKKKKKNHESQT